MASQHRLLVTASFVFSVGAAATAGEISVTITGSPLPWAAPEPKECSKREHLGRLGYLVDQAWQAYRRLEISSPLRVGWCGCAKQCEPIDELAARYEEVAFRAKAASVDLSIPPDQRNEYGRLSTDMFAERNRTVNSFRDCLDATRPALSPPNAMARKPIPGHCEKADLSLEDRWKLWCAAFEEKWKPIAADFSKEFKKDGTSDYWLQVPLKATAKGKISLNGREGFQGVPKVRRKIYIDRLTAIEMDPFPEGTQWASWSWGTTIRVINGADSDYSWAEPMDCPKD
jgi:hypothetical protein